MRKKLIVVTGGAGFIGSHLIEKLVKNKNLEIISIDNYSTGKKKNHIKSKNCKYISGDIKNISSILKKFRKKIDTIFHFGEFSRIFQSFIRFEECINTNDLGTKEVFMFALKHKIKIIYSATSASLGKKGNDKNLSPYAFTKSKNLEMLVNFRKWFGLNYETIYFYNVYGNRQICEGEMATVIGIFEKRYKEKLPLTVVKPGTQSRKFTHIDDTVRACLYAWKKNQNKHYSISAKENYSIVDVAKMFKTKFIYLPKRSGERYASRLLKMHLNKNVVQLTGKIKLKEYINNIIKKEHE
tara:strand:- start:672 stop:1562 length:891 start_codon:yes stop_codon:yes gene_type:complete